MDIDLDALNCSRYEVYGQHLVIWITPDGKAISRQQIDNSQIINYFSLENHVARWERCDMESSTLTSPTEAVVTVSDLEILISKISKRPFDREDHKRDKCYDCCAYPGELHEDGCDVELCSMCSGQRISCRCDPSHEVVRLKWTGEWPGVADAVEFGWYTYSDDIGVEPDIDRVHAAATGKVKGYRWSTSDGKVVKTKD